MRLSCVLHHTGRDTLQGRARGTARRWPRGPSPQSQHPAYNCSRGRGAHRVTSTPPALGGSPLGSPALVSPHGNHRASVGSSTGNLTLWQTTGGGASRQQHRGDLGGQSSCLQSTQEAQPAACSAAAQLAGTVWPGNSGGAQVCPSRAFKWGGLPALQPGLPTSIRGAEF